MIKRYLILIIYLLFQMTYLQAGNLDTTHTTNQKTMYTLEDIYIKLTTGSNISLLNHSLSPSAPPGATMHTLNQIFSNIPSTNDLRAGVSGGVLFLPGESDVKNGVNYGASGTEFTGFYTGNGTTNNITNIIYTNADFLVQRSGQITSYRAGDDGTYRKGFTGEYTNADGSWDGNTRFTTNAAGNTVTDNLTGLMWTRDANQGPGTKIWNDAVDGATSCSVGGYNDWRLPNRFELESLLDLKNNFPTLSTGHPFINVQNTWYWTSTTYAGITSLAWYVIFNFGDMNASNKDSDVYVWYVRAGQ